MDDVGRDFRAVGERQVPVRTIDPDSHDLLRRQDLDPELTRLWFEGFGVV